MAFDYLHTFEGYPDPTTFTVAGSDDFGDPLYTSFSLPAGNTLTIKSGAALAGTRGLELNVTAANTQGFVQTTLPNTAVRLVHNVGMRFPTLPTTAVSLGQMRTSTTQALQLQLDATGHLFLTSRVADIAASKLTTALTANVKYYAEYIAEPGATATSGIWDIYLYDSTGVVLEHKSGVGQDLGSAPIAFLRTGRYNNTAWIGIIHFDQDHFADLVTGTLGVSGLAAPSVSHTEYQAFVVNLGGTTASGGGTLTFGTPGRISGPTLAFNAIGASAFGFLQVAAGGDSVYRFPVTETPGSGTTVDITIPEFIPGNSTVYAPTRWDTATSTWVAV